MSGQSLHKQKAALRNAVRQELQKLSPEDIDTQSAAITKHLLSMKEYQQAHAISIFLSMPGREVSTHGVVLDALRSRKKVFIPYIHSPRNGQGKQMDMLELRDEVDLSALKPDAWGIPSLDPGSLQSRQNALGGRGIEEGDDGSSTSPVLDLILIPAVTFDRSHRRLGHGKGFYDRYLERLDDALAGSTSRKPPLVGLALRQQLLPPADSVPTDRTDRDLDRIVTPSGIV